MSKLIRELETRIARAFIKAAINHGYDVTINDGEEDVLLNSTMCEEIIRQMFFYDDVFLMLKKPGKLGWARFIFGNGWDVINDYSMNIEHDVMPLPQKISDRYA